MQNHVEIMRRQHEELLALGTQYERELAKDAPDLAALAKCRWTLARLVSAHLAYEAAHLYPSLERAGGRSSEVGRAMSAEMAEIGAQLGDHVRKWTSDAIVRDWATFASTSKALMAALRARIEREDRDLYPLAEMAKAA